MNKNKLIELRCKAWGITEDEYYCNQCSDFSLEDMARAYRRGKNKGRADLEKENAELRKVAEFQQSSNMSRYFENKKLKEGLAVGSIFNKALNSMNKSLEEDRDKYRNMVFDKIAQLDQAKEIINELLMNSYDENTREKALNFLYPDKKED